MREWESPVPIKRSPRHRRSQHAVPAASTNPKTKTETKNHAGATKAYRQPSIDRGLPEKRRTWAPPAVTSPLSSPLLLLYLLSTSPPRPPRLTEHQRADERGREGNKGRGLVTQLSSGIFPRRVPCSQRPSVFMHFSMRPRGGGGKVGWG